MRLFFNLFLTTSLSFFSSIYFAEPSFAEGGDSAFSSKGHQINIVDAWASSEYQNNLATKATDGDLQTRWESDHGEDLGVLKLWLGDNPVKISEIKIFWEAANAQNYKIEGSNDDRNWTHLAARYNGEFGERVDVVSLEGEFRFLLITGLTRPEENSWGYSIREVKVYQKDGCQAPYSGTFPTLPAIIEAEDYDIGCDEDFSYYDTTPSNEGGYYRNDGIDIEKSLANGAHVGWIKKGEWLEYTVKVEKNHRFTTMFDVASANETGAFHIEVNGIKTDVVKVPNTGGWMNFSSIVGPSIELDSGIHVIRFVADGDEFNLDTISFVDQAVSPHREFSFMVFPDTQYMMLDGSYKGSDYSQFLAQTEWVYENKDRLNIKFISHVGDVVDHSNIISEWERFNFGWGKIENSGIPWAIAPGNHDTNLPMGVGNWDVFNDHFPVSKVSRKPWFAGSFPQGRYENNLSFFSASGMDFMVLSLGYNPSQEAWEWSNRKLKEYPNKRAIISTHDVFKTQGTSIYDLAKRNRNVFLIVSGHYCDAEWHNTFTNDYGNTVHEIMSDYQCGFNGYLRYYVFKPNLDQIEAVTYAPIFDTYRIGPESSFTWYYDM